MTCSGEIHTVTLKNSANLAQILGLTTLFNDMQTKTLWTVSTGKSCYLILRQYCVHNERVSFAVRLRRAHRKVRPNPI